MKDENYFDQSPNIKKSNKIPTTNILNNIYGTKNKNSNIATAECRAKDEGKKGSSRNKKDLDMTTNPHRSTNREFQ